MFRCATSGRICAVPAGFFSILCRALFRDLGASWLGQESRQYWADQTPDQADYRFDRDPNSHVPLPSPGARNKAAQQNNSPRSKLPCEAGDTDENDSGPNTPAGTQNPPSQATNSSDDGWVHKWMRKTDEARASQPHFVSPLA